MPTAKHRSRSEVVVRAMIRSNNFVQQRGQELFRRSTNVGFDPRLCRLPVLSAAFLPTLRRAARTTSCCSARELFRRSTNVAFDPRLCRLPVLPFSCLLEIPRLPTINDEQDKVRRNEFFYSTHFSQSFQSASKACFYVIALVCAACQFRDDTCKRCRDRCNPTFCREHMSVLIPESLACLI
jgi:hypothetical protein